MVINKQKGKSGCETFTLKSLVIITRDILI